MIATSSKVLAKTALINPARENIMEVKKNIDADLEKKSSFFLNIGLCISLLLVITAFEWKFYDRGAGMDLGSIDDDFERSYRPVMPIS